MDFIDLKTQYALLKENIDGRIQKVLDHGQYILGPEVGELEHRLAAFTGAKHCISVASGTDALMIALMALGIGPGDEVIVPAFTFVATAEVVVLVGATPVFVDVDAETCNISPAAFEAAIGNKTKAVIPVGLYGQVADMDEINAIAAAHGVVVIEDAAQSFGASYKGRRSCNLSAIGCTSFFPSKPLACYGDGGAIFTSDDELAKICKEIRVHGQERRYYHTRIGVGGRMDTLQCAIVLAKMDNFEAELRQRAEAGRRYLSMLADIPGIGLPVIRPDRDCVWAQFTLNVEDREALVAQLTKAGIPTAVHYPVPLHRQPAYAPLCRISGSLKNSEWLSERVVSVPMHPFLTAAVQQAIADAVAGVVAVAA